MPTVNQAQSSSPGNSGSESAEGDTPGMEQENRNQWGEDTSIEQGRPETKRPRLKERSSEEKVGEGS